MYKVLEPTKSPLNGALEIGYKSAAALYSTAVNRGHLLQIIFDQRRAKNAPIADAASRLKARLTARPRPTITIRNGIGPIGCKHTHDIVTRIVMRYTMEIKIKRHYNI